MIQIPKQLQNEEFRFILVAAKEKKPIEKDWVLTNNYKFDNKKLLEHLAKDGNYGVLCGPGNLFVLDIDVKNAKPKDFLEFEKLETFQVQTGGGGLHVYFVCDGEIKDFENETLTIGEFKLRGVQVVGPNSIYTNGRTKYEVSKDLEIAEISKEKFTKFYENIISPYKRKNLTPTDELQTPVGDSLSDTSRSGIDFKTLRYLISSGLSNEKIIEQMKAASIRWSSLATSKQNWELDNARKSLEKFPDKTTKLYKTSEDANKDKKLNFLFAKDLMNYSERTSEWIVENLIKDSTINVLAGKRSTMKSWISLILSYCIAYNQKFLGKFSCVQGKVLFIDRENNLMELKTRQQMILKGLNLEVPDSNVIFLSEQHVKLDSLIDLSIIEKFVIENNVKLIVADTYRRLISFKEDSADEVSRFFVDVLKPFCERTHTTFLLLHHERKGHSEGDEMDMLRGSSDLANYVDGIIQLERKGHYLIVKQTKSRVGKELEPFQIKIDTDELTYFKAEYGDEIAPVPVKIAQKIFEWSQTSGKSTFSYTEILSAFENLGFKRNSILNALEELQRTGVLSKETGKRGLYKMNLSRNSLLF
jgi:hypothetical protein